MKTLRSNQEMRPRERGRWLRETWGVQIQYSPSDEWGNRLDTLREGRRIGGILCNGNFVVLALPGVDEVESDSTCNQASQRTAHTRPGYRGRVPVGHNRVCVRSA